MVARARPNLGKALARALSEVYTTRPRYTPLEELAQMARDLAGRPLADRETKFTRRVLRIAENKWTLTRSQELYLKKLWSREFPK